MKKLGLIISALALVLGMSQCKKPNQPIFGSGVSQTITFTTGNNGGGAKGDFDDQLLQGALNYKWSDSDKIYVFASADGIFEEGHSQFCGILNFKSCNKIGQQYVGVFENTISMPFASGKVKFVHYGQDVTVNSETGEASVSFAEQNGKLKVTEAEHLAGQTSVSSKVIALSDPIDYKSDGSYNTELKVAFAVAKFSFEKFNSETKITLKTKGNTKISVGACGAISYNTTGEINFNITTDDDKGNNKNAYFAVMMPRENRTYLFNDNVYIALLIEKEIKGNKYYTDNIDGVSIILNAKPIETDDDVNFNDDEVWNIPLWGKYNLGVSKADLDVATKWYGDYYAWGEVAPNKAKYDWDTYTRHYDPSLDVFIKYNTTDGKTTLESVDDAAYTNATPVTVWRMPSSTEWQQLKDNTYVLWLGNYNGVSGLNGYLVFRVKDETHKGWWTDGAYVTKNKSGVIVDTPIYTMADPHIFLPAAGYRERETDTELGISGTYWSSSRCEEQINAYYTSFYHSVFKVNLPNGRHYGFRIRPVSDVDME